MAGGEITSTFDHPELVKLGYCDLIEEIIVGEDKVACPLRPARGRTRASRSLTSSALARLGRNRA